MNPEIKVVLFTSFGLILGGGISILTQYLFYRREIAAMKREGLARFRRLKQEAITPFNSAGPSTTTTETTKVSIQ